MDAGRVIDALNAARSRELAVIIQYMEHHYVAAGLVGMPSFAMQTRGDIWVNTHGSGFGARLAGTPGPVVTLKSVAKVEMLHAQSFGNRVTALGGVPTVTPGERCKASTVPEMLRLDVAAEDEAVCLYAESMDMCRSEGDKVSGALFESILRDEIAHSAAFRALIG
jgi:bacterioferritin (cytochrome b1)